MTPDMFLKQTQRLAKELEAAKKLTVKVGLPQSKLSGKAYDSGATITEIGTYHEYGIGVPQRSFLRMPFELKNKELQSYIRKQFVNVVDGTATARDALGLVGVFATNISKEAFTTNGYGQWAEITGAYKKRKEKAGKTTPLVWSGLLRGSITWSVE